MFNFNKPASNPASGKIIGSLALLLSLQGWALASESTAGALSNFGDPNFVANVATPLLRPAGQWNSVFRWLQIGDSHTAGDYFSGEIRRQLQMRYGNAGIGWITPGYVKNQRHDAVKLSNAADWKVYRAIRQPTLVGSPPPGGFVGNGNEAGSGFRITFKTPEPQQLMRVSVMQASPGESPAAALEISSDSDNLRISQEAAKSGWRMESVLLNIGGETLWLKNADGGTGKALLIGGINIERLSPGVIVNTLGVNGAQIDEFLAWDDEALNTFLHKLPPNLVVLAFGTNEAVAENFDAQEFAAKLSRAIQRIRQGSQAAIMLITPMDFRQRPTSSKIGRSNPCGTTPANLVAVIDTLIAVARKEKTLLWNWKKWGVALGAHCGTSSLARMNPPLAREDLIHLTPEGYKASGESLLADLLKISGLAR